VPQRFKIGSKSGKVKTVMCEEKYLKGHVAEIQETLDRGGSIAFAIFPDSLRTEVEKEFPGVDYEEQLYMFRYRIAKIEIPFHTLALVHISAKPSMTSKELSFGFQNSAGMLGQ
jgi:hypothetical protein